MGCSVWERDWRVEAYTLKELQISAIQIFAEYVAIHAYARQASMTPHCAVSELTSSRDMISDEQTVLRTVRNVSRVVGHVNIYF